MRKIILTIGFLICAGSIFAQTTITTGMSGAQVRTAINGNFNQLFGNATTGSGTGIVLKGSIPFLHDYPGTADGMTVYTLVGHNLFFGKRSGNFTLTTAHANVGVGDSTFARLTTGSINTAMGNFAGARTTSGHANTFIGRAAGWYNTTGGGNNFLGESAGERNTTGNYNNYYGVNAGMYMQTGSSNLAIGEDAMFGGDWENPLGPIADSGSFNIAIGQGSLYSLTSGDRNICIGVPAGAITTGSNNLAIGNSAMGTSQTVSNNIAIGELSMHYLTSGAYNTAVGQSSLLHGAGDYNVALGYMAGSRETGSNKLFIDNQDRTNEANARITSLIYGVFDAAPVNQKVTINGLLKLLPLADPPAGAVLGDIYCDTDTHLYFYNGSTWVRLDN